MTDTGKHKTHLPDTAPPGVADLVQRIAGDNAAHLPADRCEEELAQAVSKALEHARSMVSMLGVPLGLTPGRQPRAPLAQALFASSDEELDVLNHAALVRSVFEEQTRHCVFLLTMRRREYELLGSELEGDMVRSGVLQHAVEFLDHHVPLAAPSREGLGNMLAREIVLYLASIAPKRIIENKAAKAEILRSQEILKAQLRTLEQARGEHRPFSVPATLRDMLHKGERELAGFREKLSALPQALDKEQCLLEIREILSEPEKHIRLERIEMRVGDFGVKSAAGDLITFHECVCDSGHRLAVVMAEMTADSAAALWPDLVLNETR